MARTTRFNVSDRVQNHTRVPRAFNLFQRVHRMWLRGLKLRLLDDLRVLMLDDIGTRGVGIAGYVRFSNGDY